MGTTTCAMIRCSRQLWKSSVEQSDPANSTLERILSSSSKLARILHHHTQEHECSLQTLDLQLLTDLVKQLQLPEHISPLIWHCVPTRSFTRTLPNTWSCGNSYCLGKKIWGRPMIRRWAKTRNVQKMNFAGWLWRHQGGLKRLLGLLSLQGSNGARSNRIYLPLLRSLKEPQGCSGLRVDIYGFLLLGCKLSPDQPQLGHVAERGLVLKDPKSLMTTEASLMISKPPQTWIWIDQIFVVKVTVIL